MTSPATSRPDVHKLYARLGGRWWDPFRAAWEFLTSRQAVKDLESLLRQHVTAQTRVLDIGCGTGCNLGRLLRLGIPFREYVGVDFSPSMLALARKRFAHVPNVRFAEGDAIALDIDQRYGLIVATWLLDHLDRPAEFVNSVQRFLEPSGHFVLLFYSEPKWFLRFLLSPCGRFLVHAHPVSDEETTKFTGILVKKSYSAGVAALVHIEAADHACPEGRAQWGAHGPELSNADIPMAGAKHA